jgi:hypothetical protein
MKGIEFNKLKEVCGKEYYGAEISEGLKLWKI